MRQGEGLFLLLLMDAVYVIENSKNCSYLQLKMTRIVFEEDVIVSKM